jgi:predicted Zn-dependent protease
LVVRGETPLKTDEELKTYYQSLDKLNELELLQLGKITTDLAQRDAVYMQMVTKYPEDWRGYNDLASVQIQAGNKSVGATNLDKANSISPDNGTVLLNMANLAMLNGEMAKAADLYKKAASKGADASYGMGLLAIKTGNYSEAVSQLKKSGKKDFNMALAQLLNGDASGAKATIDGMDPEKLTWNCYYLRAIVGARTSDQDMLNTNLTRSVQLNGDVRNMAKDDVEFIKYWNNPTFQAAIR